MRRTPAYFGKLSFPMAAGGALVALAALIVIAASGGFFEDDSPPDPERLAFSKSGWKTDFSKHTIPLADIRGAGVGRDGIPPLDRPTFTSVERADQWLDGINPVIAFEVNGDNRAYPLQILSWHEIVIVVLFKPGTVSALDRTIISDSKDVGATGVFEAEMDGRRLTFRWQGDEFIDNETGSVWSILGKATGGPLAGSQLTPVIHGNHFGFAWGAFKPNTLIYRGAG